MSERVFTLAEICKVCPFVYGIFGIALAVEAVLRERGRGRQRRLTKAGLGLLLLGMREHIELPATERRESVNIEPVSVISHC